MRGHPACKGLLTKSQTAPSSAPGTLSVLMSSRHCHQEFSTGPLGLWWNVLQYKSLFSTLCGSPTFFNHPRSWSRTRACHLASEKLCFHTGQCIPNAQDHTRGLTLILQACAFVALQFSQWSLILSFHKQHFLARS